jgi:hypothetical protein
VWSSGGVLRPRGMMGKEKERGPIGVAAAVAGGSSTGRRLCSWASLVVATRPASPAQPKKN